MPQNLVQRLFTIKTESHHTCYISPKYLLSQCLVQCILLLTWARCNSAYSSSSTDVTVCGLPLLFTPLHACDIRTVEQLKGRSNVCGEGDWFNFATCQNSLTVCICIRLKYGASAASVFAQIATSGINVHIVEITHLPWRKVNLTIFHLVCPFFEAHHCHII